VTSAIKQAGANQVSIIASSADRQAAIEFAKAAAIRPGLVGKTWRQIVQDPEVAQALFQILENQKSLAGQAKLVLLPESKGVFAQWLAAAQSREDTQTAPG